MMTDIPVHSRGFSWLFTAGILLLALQPILWLIETWFDPAYQSHGLWVAGLVLGCFGWSLASPRRQPISTHRGLALGLLALTAVVRLLGQVLGVNVIGALALVIDVYALGLLAGLDQRRRSLAPGWLAILFAFSLPLERILQRILGFGLQQLSATSACQLLSLGPDPVSCEGVRILLAGQDVLVDLPCSGSRGLLLLLLLFTALAAVRRPTLVAGFIGLGIALLSAFLANTLRIVVLAVGLAYPQAFGPIAVMEAPWHEIIGLLTLVLGAMPIVIWGGSIRRPPGHTFHSLNIGSCQFSWILFSSRYSWSAGLGFIAGAIVIISLPARPMDIAQPMAPIVLPAVIAAFSGTSKALSSQERAYFTRYGGGAARATYGPYGLLVVSTSAPLRHLHGPDECLLGSGHRVRYLGSRYAPMPTALYRSTGPDGRVWQVAVTFVSSQAEMTTSVAEAVWRWLKNPDTTWTMVQRIAPWNLSASDWTAWDRAVARVFDLPVTTTVTQLTSSNDIKENLP